LHRAERTQRTRPIRPRASLRRAIDVRPPAGGVSSRDIERVGAQPSPPQPEPAATVRGANVGGGRLLVSDIRVGFMVLNEARYRTFERLFGVQRDEANLLTAVALLTAAEAAHERIEQMLSGPAWPSAGATALGLGVGRELLQEVAGPASRETPLFGSLVTIAVLGGALRPAIKASAHGVAGASRRLSVAFHHRYGHLIARPDRR
jgi:hypothetical protein